MNLRRFFPLFLLLLLAAIVTAGCSIRPRRAYPIPEGSAPFRPPTLAPTPLPVTPTSQAALPGSTPTAAACTDVLKYISDISIPDGTEVLPGSTLDKRWEVENIGTCNWDQRYHLKLIAGTQMGAPKEQALFPARSGARAVIRILFTVPETEGTQKSAWQAHNPAGQPFGDPIYIQVEVKNAQVTAAPGSLTTETVPAVPSVSTPVP